VADQWRRHLAVEHRLVGRGAILPAAELSPHRRDHGGRGSSDAYHFYASLKRGIWRDFGVGFNNDAVLIVEPGAEYCNTTGREEGWHGFIVPRHLVPLDPATRGDRARYAYTIKGQQRRA
jgi:hypothetical protein